MQMRMNVPDVASFEVVQRVALELGLKLHMEHGPKDEALEGLRIVTISGNPFTMDLPRRLVDMQNQLAIEMTKMMETKMTYGAALDRLMSISPNWL